MPEPASRHLLSLPAEIAIQIIDDLGLDDTWSLAQSGKEVYDVCQPAMRRHKENKEKYSTICLGPPFSEDDGSEFEGIHPLFFVEQIIRDPKIASYVTKLRTSRCRSEPDERDFKGDGFTREQEQLAATLANIDTEPAFLAAHCPWLATPEHDSWRDALLKHNNQPHHVAILLTMLPKLRSIYMRGMSLGDSYIPVVTMVWAIAEANHDQSSTVHGKALSRLTEISIDHWDTEGGENIDMFKPFVALPSMRCLRGRMMYGEADPVEDPPTPVLNDDGTHRKSQIDEINITYSTVESKAFEPIFKTIKNLKKFTYEHEGATIGYTDYDGSTIVGLLRDSFRHSLEHLDLTCNMDYNEEDQSVGDLTDFQTLRVLRINALAFSHLEFIRGMNETVYSGLADKLPASIRDITLLAWDSGNPMELLGELAGNKDRLSDLRRICVEGRCNIPKDHLDACKNAGIEVVVVDMRET
ncbi:MAG: hypothetical protein Q9169_007388 [Polycauliona sp. 2 TL-2023]